MPRSFHVSAMIDACLLVAVLVSAFLLFQVQPLFSKSILPWFGGSPTVWTTCMLFFQLTLFAGYSYAHLLATRLPRRLQAALHVALCVAAMMFLPLAPTDHWKPVGTSWPEPYIMLLLLVHLGLPYFVLSANGPLLQHWFGELNPGRSPYRLYALSNTGSLLALLSYPFVIEPSFSLGVQSAIWSWSFVGFVILILPTAWTIAIQTRPGKKADLAVSALEPADGVSRNQLFAWLTLPAVACIVLLATTNHVCQDMAVVPFLWVAPLSLYLLTFILCFDADGWYRRERFAWCVIVGIAGLGLLERFGGVANITLTVSAYFAVMFLACMMCHGELARLKPAPRYLTLYFLMISAGGALGGLTVSLLCPWVFSQYYEMPISWIVVLALAGWAVTRRAPTVDLPQPVAGRLLATAVIVLAVSLQLGSFNSPFIHSRRNFYGVLNIDRKQDERLGWVTEMYHGRIIHGFQFEDPDRREMATAYYAPESGVGLVMTEMNQPNGRKIGVVGLGAGTLATYGRRGDKFRFYEINPDVVRLANDYFSYLRDSRANVEIALGDARLSLENEQPQAFDILVLDAFSGDAIPTHLLTCEAFDVYRQHLNSDGILAIHISNMHLDLRPVVEATCQFSGFTSVYIEAPSNPALRQTGSQWVLAAQDHRFLSKPVIQAAVERDESIARTEPWTDDFSNLLEVIK